MEFISLLFISAMGIHWLNLQGQRKRTALLAEQLRPYQIEKHMEQLTGAYMRALGEGDAERQQQILESLKVTHGNGTQFVVTVETMLVVAGLRLNAQPSALALA
jgi:hypothetical protein